jgi:mono/diheme cytochrome c family protein
MAGRRVVRPGSDLDSGSASFRRNLWGTMKLRLRNRSRFAALPLIVGLLVPAAVPVAAGPVPAQSADTAAGLGVFKAKCASCHGSDGSGNTAVGKSLKTADLRTPEVQKKSDADLTQSIQEGKGNMPAFKSMLSDDEIHAVLAYVRTLGAKGESAPKKKAGN